MNKTARRPKIRTIESEEKCREEKLKEFFELREEVLKILDGLYKTGIAPEVWLRLKGVKVEEGMEDFYEPVSKRNVRILKRKLINLKAGEEPKKIMASFSGIKVKGWIASIPYFIDMENVYVDILISNDAIDQLQTY